MTVHQCPKCELRFDWKTEVDDHCRADHPDFRHDYPAVHAVTTEPAVAPRMAPPAPQRRAFASPVGWLVPRHRREDRGARH